MKKPLINQARRWAVALCLLFPLHCGAAQFVEITAGIELFSIPRNPTNDQNFSVVCIVATNEWRIDPSFRETGTSQWFFDGTNVYNNIIAIGGPRPIGARIRTGKPLAAVTNSSVHIRESRYGCPLDDWQVNIPWLAFCSGTYLKREGRLIPQPIVRSLRHAPDGFAYSDKTETFKDEFGLPRTIDLFASDALFAASVTNGVFEGKRDVELWKRGSTGFKWDFPDGALKFHYAVTESTNFLGWNFPVKFELFLNERGTNGNIVARGGGSGRVTSIRASGKPKSVMTGQNVVDWRFRDATKKVGAIIYQSTNAYVAPTNDPALQEKFKKRMERQVPEGRSDISLASSKNLPMPKVGELIPEISAKEWINLKTPPTLASLRGKVVVLEVWKAPRWKISASAAFRTRLCLIQKEESLGKGIRLRQK